MHEQDWRLEVRLEAGVAGRAGLHLHRVRAADLVDDVRAVVAHDVVVTHDGRELFAYGATHQMLDAAREAIDAVTQRTGLSASVVLSHWDDALGSWRQIDPPPDAELAGVDDAAARSAQTVETRTLVCIAGKLVRARFEQTMQKSAGILGIECVIAERPRLLTTHVTFTVTGPRGKLDSFRAHLVAQGWATIRADALTMNPTA
ncbi:MAG TPA: hypothetical protein VG165_12285 [Solirubrobacteraceae bacterium]|jgi:hypothetical protein|nr:hypothetical protein [Solirubrobacteraceae bacterium]